MKVAFVDFETTGLNAEEGKPLEIALVLAECSEEDILKTEEIYCSYNDPGFPITEEIQKITNINDELVKGHKIDWAKVNELLDKADIIVAHNAQFDKAWALKHGNAANRPWVCSVNQVNWKAHPRIERSNLEYLKQYFGIDIPSHRAINDVMTLLRVLKQRKTNNETFWSELYKNKDAALELVYVYVPFEFKDKVKAMGFYWTPDKKAWRKNAMPQDIPALKEKIMGISNLIKFEKG